MQVIKYLRLSDLYLYQFDRACFVHSCVRIVYVFFQENYFPHQGASEQTIFKRVMWTRNQQFSSLQVFMTFCKTVKLLKVKCNKIWTIFLLLKDLYKKSVAQHETDQLCKISFV